MNYAIIKSALKKLWLQDKNRSESKRLARIGKNRYVCAECKEQFAGNEVQVDHIVPIGRFTNWTDWINRLFCETNELQVLCKSCHLMKTNKERR